MNAFTIQVRNATVYLGGMEILSRIDWTMRPGENWAVVGNNGSGKTTLMKLLFGDLLPLDGGTVHWFNSRVWHGLMDVREKVGFVSAEFQESYDRNVTALEVVESGFFSSIGLWEAVKHSQVTRAREQMQRLGIAPLASKRYDDLSYGEARRVLLARALVHRPDLLVLDEPCAGLDIPTREGFLDTLKRLSKKTSIIYVTHHVDEILPNITHVMLLKKGKIFAQGKKEEVLTGPRLSKALDCRMTVEEKGGRYWVTDCKPAKKH